VFCVQTPWCTVKLRRPRSLTLRSWLTSEEKSRPPIRGRSESMTSLTGIPVPMVRFTSLTFNWRGALCAESAQSMRDLGINLPTLEIMSTRVLEWGHRAWRESRDATWIRMDLVPSARGRTQTVNEHTGTRDKGRRRRLAARPPRRPSGPALGSRSGRPVQVARHQSPAGHRAPVPSSR